MENRWLYDQVVKLSLERAERAEWIDRSSVLLVKDLPSTPEVQEYEEDRSVIIRASPTKRDPIGKT